MDALYSLSELAASVQAWCEEHHVSPANGQAADAISERTIRYYRSLGMLDAPASGSPKSFTEKHRLQLLAIRLHQAEGLPLRRIREQLYGQGEPALQALVDAAANSRGAPIVDPFAGAPGVQQWTVAPLGDDFVVMSRRGRCLRPELLAKLREVLAAEFPPASTPTNPQPKSP